MNAEEPTASDDEVSADCLSCSREWETIDWNKAEKEVNKLQCRIAKATEVGNFRLVKQLQYLLSNSFHAKCLAVRKVTSNRGKNTPGVDGVIWNSSSKKMKAVRVLNQKRYRTKPLRRVYIPKKNGKKRPLGIPTMHDRAMQALFAIGLEPIAEITADPNSYGFRKGRCCQDAAEQIFKCLSRKDITPQWILEGDIKGMFDNISHEWLMSNIPMDKRILRRFLKTGFMDSETLYPTESGTPQGGIISPILANMALDGMESMLKKNYKRKEKVNLTRYADDWIITAVDEQTAERVKKDVADFLEPRGLTLSTEKTRITHTDVGFDFLGFSFRKYGGKLLIKPSKDSVKSVKGNIRAIVKDGASWKQEILIKKLNPVITGWANYHRHNVSKVIFSEIDDYTFKILYGWAKRRHPNKGKRWVKDRYWHRKGRRNWVFADGEYELRKMDKVRITRHVKVRAASNPFADKDYFESRGKNPKPKCKLN